MKSLAELEIIRDRALKELSVRKGSGKRIIVGMATCGIAAGARPVMNAFVEELEKRNINDVRVTMTGCIGVCRYEPIVDVIDEENKKTTYVNMNPEKAARVVAEHLVNGRVCREYTITEAENGAK